jgi:hypothetical protein
MIYLVVAPKTVDAGRRKEARELRPPTVDEIVNEEGIDTG